MKKQAKVISVALVLCMVVAMFAACTAVQISGKLTINADNSGTRTIVAMIAKNDDKGDGYGTCYYFFKQHGDALKAKLEGIYTENVDGSADWLTVAVDDTGADWEYVTLTVAFTSFEDYVGKMKALAFDAEQAGAFVEPTFTRNADGTFTYSEPASTATAIFKSLQAAVMADETLFDEKCTKDGVELNTNSDFNTLKDYGVELIKPENGNVLTLNIDGGADIVATLDNGVYTFTGTADGKVPEVEHVTTKIFHYGFDETLTNAGTAADTDLVYGKGSTEGGPVYEDGIVGKGIKLDGKTYLASPNRDYKYKELTISFYYRMDAYTETDTGANMIIVPAGLGALNAGVIDVEFIKETTAPGVQLLAKMNSVDWMTQDKLYSEEYMMENRLGEWHHYAIVYQNEYEDGEISDAFVYMYIDGKVAARSRLSVAAGLPYSLGSFDDGSMGEPNGGFNVGGYFEADIVKRAGTGCLDELMVFDGALTQEEINSMCYTVKVAKEYDPNAEETPSTPNTPSTPDTPNTPDTPSKPDEPKEGGMPTGAIIAIVAVVVLAVAAVVFVVLRKKKA